MKLFLRAMLLILVMFFTVSVAFASSNLNLTARDNMVYTIHTYKVKQYTKVQSDGSTVLVYFVFRPLRAGWVHNGVEKYDNEGNLTFDSFPLNDDIVDKRVR